MKYRITATRIDANGVRVASNDAETLGDYHQYIIGTRKHAERAKAALDASKDDCGMPDAEYSIDEVTRR